MVTVAPHQPELASCGSWQIALQMQPLAPLAPSTPSRFPLPRALDLRPRIEALATALHLQKVLRAAIHPQSWWTTLGAALGVGSVLVVTQRTLGSQSTPCIVASMGASAVILYAMPETPAARMWPLFGGHLLSATAGVLTTRYLTDPTLGVAIAVGASLFLMGIFRCVHPPGGATALTVVMGGAELRGLGFGFLVAPLLLNLLVLASTTWLLRSVSSTERRVPLS
jgi:CBS domain-containing membrane protein